MKTCRIGIIGTGRIGKLHAENICRQLPQFSLLGIADPYLDHDWAKSLRIPLVTKENEDLIQHPDIDVILIASPSTFHPSQIVAASCAKKAIFCEKPLGLTEMEIGHCLDVVNHHQTLLQVGFNRRFDPDFAYLQQSIRRGKIGKPHLVQITSRDPAPPPKEYIKTSGGIFMDMSIHDFDMARFLMGSEVTEVYAEGSVLIHSDFAECNDVDTAVIQLRFASGALGVINNSRQAVYGYDQRVEVFGSEGTLLTHNQRQHAVIHLNKNETQLSNPLYFFLERYEAAYLAEMKAFYEAWYYQQPSPVSGWDGLQALRIAVAAKQSLLTHQPVKIPQSNVATQGINSLETIHHTEHHVASHEVVVIN